YMKNKDNNMPKDVCSKCGATKSKTFWDFKDNSVLCDSCNKKFGKNLEKSINQNRLIVFVILIVLALILLFIILPILSPQKINSEDTKEANNSKPYYNPTTTQTINECASCPTDSDWSGCINGIQTSTAHVCNQSTGFQCQSFIKTQQCGLPKPPIQQNSDSNPKVSGTLTNNQLFQYQQLICSKIEPTNPLVRNTAASIASVASGEWNVNQLVELYLWMKNRISYVNDPVSQGYFASATETLNDKAGDCEDQAILVSSFIQSIGGISKVVIAPDCGHAFASVFISNSKEDFDATEKTISDIYSQKGIYDLSGQNFFGYKDDQGYWLNVDPAGGSYLGDTYVGCRNINTFYPINCTGITPKLNAQITNCQSNLNILQGLGEVTDVYVSITNSGAYDLHNIKVTAHASDEDQPYKNTANYTTLQVGQTASTKLTLDTQQNVPTLVTVTITSDEGTNLNLQINC
ncbi:MAG: transglutaminase-like domain-containing protein, partial [Sphaerochaetaceae bacterium]|nr:transglutaminase-like domain-containing protein [Sphaerochaetaceae bacterium]